MANSMAFAAFHNEQGLLRSLHARMRRLIGANDRHFDQLRPNSFGAEIHLRQVEQLIKQNLYATIPCTTTLVLAFLISLKLPTGPLLQVAIAVRALCNAAFMVVLSRIANRLEQGRLSSRHERLLGLGTFFSSLLWGVLIWPLEPADALGMMPFMIITIALVSIVVTMLIAAHHLPTLRMAALGGFVGVAPAIFDTSPGVVPVLVAGLAVLIVTIWGYGARLNREARRGIVMGMRIEGLSRRLALANEAMERALANAQWLADRDSLTGLRNRRAFERDLRNQAAEVRKQGKVQFILLLDIDHFKRINDRFGHDFGDSVLVAVSTALGQWESETSHRIVGRWGGEEFIAVIALDHDETLHWVAEELRQRIEATGATLCWPAEESLTTSIGCSELESPADLDRALFDADGALYAAKDSGRNCWRLAA